MMSPNAVFELLAQAAADPAGPCPASAEGEALRLYDGLEGSWDIVSTWYEGGEPKGSRRGEWHFSKVLGGCGMLDLLFAEGASPGGRGVTLRCYDPGRGAWRVAWMMPSGGEFAWLSGRREGDRIVQEGEGPRPGERLRWSFSELGPDSFLWRGELSRDGGQRWELEQEMRASRKGPRGL